ncbi:hypothetical protein [Methanimicrococcus hacksteinii]|uniref:hypothetical protein n=1 Tax=Methanimicrococcus hacksteinii TaxID=3028293 RepID=UPI00298F17EA|nr:hypothetical protein [Methanimicrococcus sp. At1]
MQQVFPYASSHFYHIRSLRERGHRLPSVFRLAQITLLFAFAVVTLLFAFAAVTAAADARTAPISIIFSKIASHFFKIQNKTGQT